MITIHDPRAFLKRPRRAAPLDPARHWFAIFTTALLAFAILVVGNVWMFNVAAQGGVIGAPPAEAPPVFDRSSLSAIRTVFSARAGEAARYETGAYSFTDPSQEGLK